MKNSLGLHVICLIFVTKLYNINGNEHLFTSKEKNVYYIESEQMFTWYDALAKCANMNMSLLTIDTKLKSQDITTLLNDIFGKKTILWICGCVNGNNPRQFVWISTGKQFIYNNWAKGQPDFAGNIEYCAQVGFNDDMQWNDNSCSGKFGFIREYNQLHDCQEKLQIKLQEDMKKQQQVALQQALGEFNKNIESRTFRDIVFNINQNAK